jgi:hypothetical protein
MDIDLGGDDIGQKRAAVKDDGSSGFVAGTFDAEKEHVSSKTSYQSRGTARRAPTL